MKWTAMGAWRRVRRVMGVAGLVVAVVLGLWVAVAPRLVRRIAVGQLAALGLPEPRLEIRGVSLSHVDMANVAAGGDRLSVGAVGVRFSVGEVLGGRLSSIELTGVELELRVRDGQLDLGPLADLGGEGEGGGELPFQRIDVRSSALVLDLEGERRRIPVRGTLETGGDGVLNLALEADLEGSPLRLTGTLEGPGLDLTLTGHLRELGALWAAVPPRLAALPGRPWGALAITAHFTGDGQAWGLTGRAAAAPGGLGLRLADHELSADTLAVDVQATLDEDFGLDALSVAVDAGSLAVDGAELASAQVTARTTEDGIALTAAAEAPGWKLSKLEGTVTGLLECLRGEHGEATAACTWTASSEAVGRLFPPSRGFDATALGAAQAEGRLTARLQRVVGESGTGWAWRVEAPDIAATLGPGTLRLADAVLSGIEGRLAASAKADAAGARLSILAGTKLAVAKGSASFGSIAIALGRGTGPALSLQVGQDAGELTLTAHGEAFEWAARLPVVGLDLTRGSVSLPERVAAEGVAARGRLALHASATEVGAAAAPGATIAINSLSIPDVALRKAAAGPALSLEVGGTGAQARLVLSAQRPRWLAALSHATVRIAETTVALPDERATLEGLSALLALNVDASQDLAVVNLPGESWGALKGVRVPLGDETVRTGPLRLIVRERGKAPLLAAGREDGQFTGRAGFELAAPDAIEVTLASGVATTLGPAAATVEARFGPDGASADARLSVERLGVKLDRMAGGENIVGHLAGASLAVTCRGELPGDNGAPPRLTAQFDLGAAADASGLEARVAGLLAQVPQVLATGTVEVAQGQPPTVDATVKLADASLEHGAAGFAVTGISAEIPATWHRPATRRGTLAIKTLHLGIDELPGPAGALWVEDGRVGVDARWEPLTNAELAIEGYVRVLDGSPHGRFDLSMPLFTIEDENELSRRLSVAEGIALGGAFALSGQLRIDGARLLPRLTLTLHGATLKSTEWQAEAEGVYATLKLDSVAPLATAGKELQLVMVKRARVGTLEVEDGFVAFRLEPRAAEGQAPWTAATIQRAEWGWLGGRLFVENVRYDPHEPVHRFTMFARDLKLGDLLTLVTSERATGVGALDGHLPVAIAQWPQLKFGEGFLQAEPGRTGWITIRDQALIRTLVGAARAPAARDVQDEVRKRLLEAVRNFEYDELRVDFYKWTDERQTDRIGARLFTKGRGRTGAHQEIGGYTVNIPNFDKAVVAAIIIERGLGGTRDAATPAETPPASKGDPP